MAWLYDAQAASRLTQSGPQKQKHGIVCNDPPSEMCHPAHPNHKLKLMTTAAAPFLCNGCKEPGYGPRYTCAGGGGQSSPSMDLHTRCAFAADPLLGLSTLVLPLFGYGMLSNFRFRLLHQPPPPPPFRAEARDCDACGEATRGCAYYCLQQGLGLHPCCASLPDRFLHGGRAFELHRKASRPCVLCSDTDESRRRSFWTYSSYSDGEAAVDLHVACLKEAARRSWEASYRDQDAGDGTLENALHSSIGLDRFGEIAGTVASFITAVVFGHPIPRM